MFIGINLMNTRLFGKKLRACLIIILYLVFDFHARDGGRNEGAYMKQKLESAYNLKLFSIFGF